MVAMMSGYGGGGWAVVLMAVGMLVFLGLLIWVAYAVITSAARRPGRERRGEDARGVLNRRLARGEIDAAQYQRLRDLIGSGDYQAPAGTGSKR
jgi:uncharacterized membrane protein